MDRTEAGTRCQKELKPCPFCGSPAVTSTYYIECSDMGGKCSTSPKIDLHDYRFDLDTAVAAWNTRHESIHCSDLQAVRESLERIANPLLYDVPGAGINLALKVISAMKSDAEKALFFLVTLRSVKDTRQAVIEAIKLAEGQAEPTYELMADYVLAVLQPAAKEG